MKAGNILNEYMMSSRCEITNCNRLMLYGCKKVLCYRNDFVKVALSDFSVEICGSELAMKSYFESDIELCGKISDIHFCEKRCKGGKNS